MTSYTPCHSFRDTGRCDNDDHLEHTYGGDAIIRGRAVDETKLYDAAMATRGVYGDVAAERLRAHSLHGRNSIESTPAGDPRRYLILAEEVGEVAKVYNEAAIAGVDVTSGDFLDQLYAEAIQTAAMATALAEALLELKHDRRQEQDETR